MTNDKDNNNNTDCNITSSLQQVLSHVLTSVDVCPELKSHTD